MSDLVNRNYLSGLLGLEGNDRSLSNTDSLSRALTELRMATDLVQIRWRDQVMIDLRATQTIKEDSV